MYPTVNFEDTLYVAGWEGIYRRTSGSAWQEICPSSLDIAGEQWTGLAVVNNSLVFVGSDSGLFACNPTTGGATQVLDSGQVLRLGIYNGELIVTGGSSIGGLFEAGYFVARYMAELPATNSDARRNTDTTLLLITLAALTALAGVQIRRRA
jgi:outer membrane protein assembly factor BamB